MPGLAATSRPPVRDPVGPARRCAARWLALAVAASLLLVVGSPRGTAYAGTRSSELITLRYQPAKGFSQTLRFSLSAKGEVVSGQERESQDDEAQGRLHVRVEGVGAAGVVDQLLTLSDARASDPDFDFEAMGLPQQGTPARQRVSPLGRILSVPGKDQESGLYDSVLVYPEKAVPLGGTWEYSETVRLGRRMPTAIETSRGTLVQREQFRGEEAYRIRCHGAVALSRDSAPRFRLSGGGTATFLVRARDGTRLYQKENASISLERRRGRLTEGFKVLQTVRSVFEEEAPGAPSRTRP